MVDISRDEWLQALGEALVEPKDDPLACTMAELQAKAPKVSRVTIYRQVLKLIAEGRCKRTWKNVVLETGFNRRMPAYRIIANATVAGKAVQKTPLFKNNGRREKLNTR